MENLREPQDHSNHFLPPVPQEPTLNLDDAILPPMALSKASREYTGNDVVYTRDDTDYTQKYDSHHTGEQRGEETSIVTPSAPASGPKRDLDEWVTFNTPAGAVRVPRWTGFDRLDGLVAGKPEDVSWDTWTELEQGDATTRNAEPETGHANAASTVGSDAAYTARLEQLKHTVRMDGDTNTNASHMDMPPDPDILARVEAELQYHEPGTVIHTGVVSKALKHLQPTASVQGSDGVSYQRYELRGSGDPETGTKLIRHEGHDKNGNPVQTFAELNDRSDGGLRRISIPMLPDGTVNEVALAAWPAEQLRGVAESVGAILAANGVDLSGARTVRTVIEGGTIVRSASSSSEPHTADQPKPDAQVDQAEPPPQSADDANKPPPDQPPAPPIAGEPGPDDEANDDSVSGETAVRRAWAPNQIPQGIPRAIELLSPHIDIDLIFESYPTARRVIAGFLAGKTEEQIAADLSEERGKPVPTPDVSKAGGRALRILRSQAERSDVPPDVVDQLPKPEGRTLDQPPDPESIGFQIKQKLAAIGMTPQQLADILGVHPRAVERYLSDRTPNKPPGELHIPTLDLIEAAGGFESGERDDLITKYADRMPSGKHYATLTDLHSELTELGADIRRDLTEQQREILDLVEAGMTRQQIMDGLGLVDITVTRQFIRIAKTWRERFPGISSPPDK